MLRTAFLSAIYLGYLAAGFTAPFVVALGYVWVDAFRPQDVAYFLLNQFPIAAVIGAAAIGTYLVMDRRYPPRPNAVTALQVAMAIWCTVTMIWAVGGEGAWQKWDWATKTVIFSAFLPFVFRSRAQIEAFVQTYLFAMAANFIPFGLKTLIAGGGYGRNLGLASGNSGLGEGGLLSTACLMVIPLAMYLARYTYLLPRWKITAFGYWGLAVLALATAVGTFQRSALIGLVVMALFMIAGSRHKILYSATGVVVGLILSYWTSDRWLDRVSSIADYQSDTGSAVLRILVWKWTLGFVQSYPLGGGFQAYIVNQISLPGNAANPGGSIQFGRAFHSIYFEMLGEQGWPGLFMFLALALLAIWNTILVRRAAKRNPDLEWCGALAVAIRTGLAVFMSAGAFVGIAFQPMFWYFVAMTVCLRAYVRQVETQDAVPASGWRKVAHGNLTAAASPLGPGGWRPPLVPSTARRGTPSVRR